MTDFTAGMVLGILIGAVLMGCFVAWCHSPAATAGKP